MTKQPLRVPMVGYAFMGASTETDSHRVIDRDDIDLIDICTPGDTHAEIAIAALEAGKHVLCEKPMANTVAEAEAMADAAAKAHGNGVRATVGSGTSAAGTGAVEASSETGQRSSVD